MRGVVVGRSLGAGRAKEAVWGLTAQPSRSLQASWPGGLLAWAVAAVLGSAARSPGRSWPRAGPGPSVRQLVKLNNSGQAPSPLPSHPSSSTAFNHTRHWSNNNSTWKCIPYHPPSPPGRTQPRCGPASPRTRPRCALPLWLSPRSPSPVPLPQPKLKPPPGPTASLRSHSLCRPAGARP